MWKKMWTQKAIFLGILVMVLSSVEADELSNDDNDSDSAAFMIVLKHEDGWQCAASLVSMHTALTTARCARGNGAGELWALAFEILTAQPAATISASARRVVRVALAGNELDPGDPALDIAIIELEAPFGREVDTRPIVMASTRGEFEKTSECYAIRALPLPVTSSAGIKRVHFRVVSMLAANDTLCTTRIPHWAALRRSMLCFSGEELCARDMGGAVVCEGKLRGVLSVTAKGDDAGQCAVTYAAQNIVHWRTFLHCAYTLRRCGRDTCKNVCSEHRLLENKVASTDTALSPLTHYFDIFTHISPTSSRTSRTAAYSSTYSSVNDSLFEVSADSRLILQSLPVFESNRPDFRAAPTRTTHPALKAGEYGDNVAEYVAEDAPAATRTVPIRSQHPSRSAEPTRSSSPAASALRVPAPATATTSKSCLILPMNYHLFVPLYYIVL